MGECLLKCVGWCCVCCGGVVGVDWVGGDYGEGGGEEGGVDELEEEGVGGGGGFCY